MIGWGKGWGSRDPEKGFGEGGWGGRRGDC